MGPVGSISQSPFLISTILDPFRLDFGCPQGKLLGAFGAWGENISEKSPRSRNIQISAMCQKTSISVYGNLRVFFMFCPPGGRGSGRPGVGVLGGRRPPMETPPDEDWEFVWVPLHAWAEIRSSPKIPLSISEMEPAMQTPALKVNRKQIIR